MPSRETWTAVGTPGVRWELDELRRRRDAALAELEKVHKNSDAGTHWDGCHLGGHTDCLAVRIERILRGEAGG